MRRAELKPEFFSGTSQFSVVLKNLNYGKSIEKLAIEPQKIAIEDAINSMKANKNTKTKALMLLREFGYEGIFRATGCCFIDREIANSSRWVNNQIERVRNNWLD